VNGHIMSAYRAARERFIKVQDYLAQLQDRCKEAARQLNPMPTDYAEPSHDKTVIELAHSGEQDQHCGF
jgi:hypothetical protein